MSAFEAFQGTIVVLAVFCIIVGGVVGYMLGSSVQFERDHHIGE